MSIRAIAKELGISRNTVRKYLLGEAVTTAALHREVAALGYDETQRSVRRFAASLRPARTPEPLAARAV